MADEVVVVGSADPVGLSRLARGLVELRELTGGAPVRVVVNRMRPTLGWSEKDIAGMVAGFARLAGLHFLPDDRAAVDRALVAGRTLVEAGDSALGRAIGASSSTRSAPSRRAGRRRPAGSGGEQQVEPADRERDHHDQQRQLTGELVPLRQQLDRAVVGGDHAQHVPDAPRRPP